MNIQYFPTQLDADCKFREVPLEEVEFETLSHCTVCGEKDTELQDLAIMKDSLTVTRCSSCGHIFHSRRPTPAWIMNWYSKNWDAPKGGVVKTGIRNSRFVLSGIKARFAGVSVFAFVKDTFSENAKMEVLEIGCGYGRELIPFRLSGHSICAIEASEHRSRFTSRLGINVKNIPIEQLTDQTFGRKFDLAFSNHVLEHVADPHVFMQKLTDVMKPGAWFALFVPNAESSFLLIDFLATLHLQHFSESSITTLLNKHGFRIHRLQKDHQLSVLARFEKDPKDGIPLAEQRPSVFEKSSLFENILGPQYREFRDREYYCHWKNPETRIKSTSALEFSESSDLSSMREIKLRWTGNEELPMHFEKFGNNPAALFWIK